MRATKDFKTFILIPFITIRTDLGLTKKTLPRDLIPPIASFLDISSMEAHLKLVHIGCYLSDWRHQVSNSAGSVLDHLTRAIVSPLSPAMFYGKIFNPKS